MAKLRHVAIKCDDLHSASKFYSALFEMEEVGRGGDIDKLGAIYLSDGTVSLALIKVDPDHVNGKPEGLNHVGFVVPDMDSAVQRAKSLGVEILVDPVAEHAGVTWETKMRTPDGVYFDFSSQGWPGISGVDH
ncbi:VOC family protein [Frankia sp. CNm7]|uniref:VOC family protein n=1 Tax=Frankia nepalensis TaxID=1836974 RepID=A0A937RJ15_9ACTN|nr:VOC family protein [Frankia nepalensis]MBL7500473.1 VOC family protein [Frankia nepalensis]MBL7512825.1 VOC family protein [Frankia nepalensis]MBL7522528.1 VOC family protein [Frankia nepalensis]MBL7631235.1 VOC family protein [Frankia nepalensis]